MPAPSEKEYEQSHTDDFEIRWKKLRSFEDTGWLTIKPLTILIGPNSSGKSSILAPLLMLAQTFLSRDIRTPLVTKGQYVDLGSFSELIQDHDTNELLELGLRYHVHRPLKGILPTGSYPPAGVEMSFKQGTAANSIVLQNFKATDLFKRNYYSRRKTKTGYSLSGAVRASEMTVRERNAVRKSRPTNFLFTSAGALSIYENLRREESEKKVDFSKEFSHYLTAVTSTSGNVYGFLRQMTYVGPLRDKPSRHYSLSAEEITSVGVRGENTASLLGKTKGAKKKKLNSWVRKFGLGTRVNLVEIADDLAGIEFEQEARDAINIADLGFGASQVFPLIVQAVSADEDTFTIAEQPEVHLHPRLQGLLGNLFVEIAKQGQRVLLETHSEHMLLRVRTLVAKGEIDADDVAIYFVDSEDGRSNIRQVRLQDDGHISGADWPDGFFDDALRESLNLAAAQIRRSSSS